MCNMRCIERPRFGGRWWGEASLAHLRRRSMRQAVICFNVSSPTPGMRENIVQVATDPTTGVQVRRLPLLDGFESMSVLTPCPPKRDRISLSRSVDSGLLELGGVLRIELMSRADERFAEIYGLYLQQIYAHCRRRTSRDRADEAAAEIGRAHV